MYANQPMTFFSPNLIPKEGFFNFGPSMGCFTDRFREGRTNTTLWCSSSSYVAPLYKLMSCRAFFTWCKSMFAGSFANTTFVSLYEVWKQSFMNVLTANSQCLSIWEKFSQYFTKLDLDFLKLRRRIPLGKTILGVISLWIHSNVHTFSMQHLGMYLFKRSQLFKLIVFSFDFPYPIQMFQKEEAPSHKHWSPRRMVKQFNCNSGSWRLIWREGIDYLPTVTGLGRPQGTNH